MNGWIRSAIGAALLATGLAAQAAVEPETVQVPAGSFVMGSDRAEREAAYRLDEAAYGARTTRTQRWYENERPRQRARIDAFAILAVPVTNAQYATFVRATGHRAPDVSEAEWIRSGLAHAWAATRRFAWSGGAPPAGREEHPVVLVDLEDARAYAGWLSAQTGRSWRLPAEVEWEKAARGEDGRRFPWGKRWNARRLNSADAGPFDTVPVGRFPEGASPFGMLDAAGQVFEWTSTTTGDGRSIVKGGSWDDRGCGVCRPAARHGRPPDLRHILIGFRLVREP
ncbi:MAG: hypothetical protein AUK49_14055 [Betaproteobacteria bacterium CG2_30_68_42]|nr:MAG: hypothetical protein AUK49_14055 [Betaproteobacteria bacterium CG2_30_68_42]